MKKQIQRLFIATLVILLGGVNTAWAAGYTRTLTGDLEVPGYKAKAFYDFQTNTPEVLPTTGDLRYRDGNIWGLHNFGSGTRSATVTIPVANGDLLVLQHYASDNVSTINRGTLNATLTASVGYQCYDITATADDITFTIARYGGIVAAFVMEKDESASTADYTINYLLDGNTVKTVTGNSAVGLDVNAESAIWVEGVKYITEGEQATSLTIASGTNVLNVNVREAATYNYSLVSNLGGAVATGSYYEGESIKVGYPRYQLSGTTLYEAAVTDKEYRKTVDLTENNVSVSVAYSAKENMEVVFYKEGEAINGMTAKADGNIPVRASGAKAATSSEDVVITTLAPGKYKLHVGIFASKTSYEGNVVNFGIGGETFAAGFTGVNLNEVASEEYTLTTSTEIKYIAEGTWADAQFDYIWIEKTGVILTDGEAITALSEYVGKEVNVTYTRQFTEGKISTVCLPFAYEKKEGDGSFYAFTNIEKEGSEYVATMTQTSSTTLEASIPYLYLPNATGEVDFSGAYTIPAELTAGSTTSNGWTFKGTFETIEWAAAPEGIYGFAAQDEDGIYQGQFVKVGKYVRIKPMRCYLENESFAGARGAKRASENLPDTIKVRLVGADGEVTAIGTISTKTGEVTLDKDAWYTLDGRRVMNPTNGLYIKNGHKVVIK